jgi:predicted kinase
VRSREQTRAGEIAGDSSVGTLWAVAGRILYLVGGAPRVGKSTLAQRLLRTDGIPWLPTDVIRTVLRRVLPQLDAVDTDPVDPVRLAEVMYPHIEQAAEVCVEEADRFLIEGFELAPSYPQRLRAALADTTVRACFLGHGTFTADDLASYRGPKPQHETESSPAELAQAAAWIRQRSNQLRDECRERGLPYIDVGALGHQLAMRHARHRLLWP